MSLVTITVDEAKLKNIEKRLGSNSKEAANVLKKAVNKTAREAKKKLAVKAKAEYAAKGGASAYTKAMTVKSATKSSPSAIITAKGEAKELKDFKVSPTRVARTGNRPKQYRGQVLRAGSMKTLEKDGVKAFITQFQSGHISVVQRVPGKHMKSNPKKEFIKKLLSPAVPQMVGNEKRVYGVVEPEIGADLQRNLSEFIRQQMGG